MGRRRRTREDRGEMGVGHASPERPGHHGDLDVDGNGAVRDNGLGRDEVRHLRFDSNSQRTRVRGRWANKQPHSCEQVCLRFGVLRRRFL